MSPRGEITQVLLLLALVTAIRLVFAVQLGLAEDEAYYWVWGQRLAAGYFDHPPAIAWVIRAGTAIVGDTEAGVRIGGLLLGAVTVGVMVLASTERVLTALMLVSLPLFFLGGILATPDVPLLAAWALGLVAAIQGRWPLVGLACGLAMLSKYTGVLLLPLIVLADPKALRTRGPWIAAAIAFVVYLPNAWWNWTHDLVSWAFQLNHVSEAPRRLDFIAAQFGLAGPILAIVCGGFWARGWRGDRRERLCWWTSLPVMIVAIWAGGEANWSAPAWLGAILGASQMTPRWRRAGSVGAGVNLALCGLVLAHAVRPLVDLPIDPLHRLEGGQTLGESVRAWGIDEVYTERYQEAALIHFYGGVPARALPGVARPDQYDLWAEPLADRALYVRLWKSTPHLPRLDGTGYDWEQVFTVTAYAKTTDPTTDRPIARWNIAEIFQR
ncbi:MAG: glycosyltransferase family 39 protein [Myxococcota bacterium]